MADYQSNFLNALQGGYNFGQQIKQQRDQSALNQLAGQAYSAAPEQRTSLLSQMAGISPQAAQQQQRAWDGDEDRRRESMTRMAMLLTSAPEQSRPGLWRQFVPTLAQYGLSELPQEYNEQTAPIITQAAQSLVQAYGGVGREQQRNLAVSPGSAIVNPATGQVVYERPFAPSSQSFEFGGPDGKPRRYTFNTRTGDYEEAQLGVPSAAASPAAVLPQMGDVQGVYASLGDKHGFQTTSTTRTPEENGRVNGVPNSQHLSGTARDFSVRGKTPEQINAFVNDLRAQGFEVIARDHGTGPHIHAELPPSASRRGQPLVGRSKEDEAGAVTAAQEAAKLSYLPQEMAIRTDAAIQQAAGTQAAKENAERVAAAPGAIQTMQTSLDSIDALLQSGNLGDIVGFRSLNPMNRVPGTEARGLIARADQIAGQAFLAAFNQLKGGGAITEREGAAATAAMARLDRSQSEADYRQALNDLKAAISPAIERQRRLLQAPTTQRPAQGGWSIQRVD